MPNVCTWVAGLAGTCWFILDEATDLPGLYILIFKQWKYHGSGFPPADANRLPIIRNWQQISSEQLLQLAIEYMRTYNCFAVCVSESQREYTKLCSLLLADLKDINNGGKTVPGLPNSPKTGIVRGNGIVRGRFACHIRNTYDVHKMWDVACQATERPPVFVNSDNKNFVAPPDGVLLSMEDDHVKGLDKHCDWESDHCGCLQGLSYVFPPLANTLRCGAAFSFYAPHPELVYRMEILALTGWSSSPMCDYRTSPCPALGSSGYRNTKYIGGPVITKDDALKMTQLQRAVALKALPAYVRQLLPKEIIMDVMQEETWLQLHGYAALSGARLLKAYEAEESASGHRTLFLRAIAGGMKAGSKLIRGYWAMGDTGIVVTGKAVIKNSILFNDSGQLHRWVADGGARYRGQILDLQPSGRVSARRKNVKRYMKKPRISAASAHNRK
jgi:hypothetical protein